MNKREKKLVILAAIVLAIFIFPALINVSRNKLKTDSGFDSSFDSGGSSGSFGSSGSSSSGGSSWGSDYGGGRSGSSSGGELVFFIFMMCSIVFIIIELTKDSREHYYGIFTDADVNALKLSQENTRILSTHNLTKKDVVEEIGKRFELIEKTINNDKIDEISYMISQNVRDYYDNLRLRNVLANERYYIDSAKTQDGFIYEVKEIDDNSLSIDLELIMNIKSALIPINKKITENDYDDMIYNYRIKVKYNLDYYFESINLTCKKSTDDFTNMGVIPIKDVENRLSNLNLDKNKVLLDAYNVYLAVQMAWMNDTLSDVENIISDEIYSQYQAQLSTLRIKHQQNVMSDFEYNDGYIADIKETKKVCYIKIIMSVKCKDYIIDKRTGNVLRGNSNRINFYRYSFIFSIAKNPDDKCPNCGAELPKEGSSAVCAFCGSKVYKYSGNMVLVEKKMISQSY